MAEKIKSKGILLLAVFVTIFGVLTLKSGGDVLFFSEEARLAAGNFVPFVLWSNFIAGFFYILTGIGIFTGKKWSINLAVALAVFTAGLFLAFGLHIFSGGLYETRTVGAMVLRTSVWIASAVILVKFGNKYFSSALT